MNLKYEVHKKFKTGFTFFEVMIATAILLVALCGLLAVFAKLLSLNENSRKLTLAISACQDKMEQIRDADFNTIYTDIAETPNFDPAGFLSGEAKGALYADNTDPDLLEVHVSVSWRERSNRILGEDINLNGILDAGEDLNADGRLNSPAQIISLIGNR